MSSNIQTEATNKRVVIASDHAGVELKEALVALLKKRNLEVDDIGAHSTEPSDFADYAHQVASKVQSGECARGILICGTGVGMAITANRHPGVRAVNCSEPFSARSSREHNNSNVLALGARVLGVGLALEIASVWLDTPFSGDERHVRRIAKIDCTSDSPRQSKE